MRLNRLKEYWESKSFKNAKAFADFLGLSASNFSELDKRDNPTRLLLALTLKTDLNIDWLLTGHGNMTVAPALAPVEAVAEISPPYKPKTPRGDASIPLHMTDETGTVLPEALTMRAHEELQEQGAYAVNVVGSAMSRMYDPGSIVVASPTKKFGNGQAVVVTLADGRMLVRIFRQKGTLIILEAVNPAFEPMLCYPSDIRHIHRITWKREPE